MWSFCGCSSEHQTAEQVLGKSCRTGWMLPGLGRRLLACMQVTDEPRYHTGFSVLTGSLSSCAILAPQCALDSAQ